MPMLSKTFVKYIQSLHHKKFRDADSVFIAEGIKVVQELLLSGKLVCKTIVIEKKASEAKEIHIPNGISAELLIAEDFEMEKISALTTPSTVLSVFEKPWQAPIELSGKLSIVLDTIQDPGNLGTIIRIADWFGVDTIICTPHCVDVYNPKVVQSTMGSIARVQVYYADVVPLLEAVSGKLPIYATSLNGENLFAAEKITEGVIIIGNESKGVSDEVFALADKKITIPGSGRAESLNAAVATGIVLSHLLKI